LAGVAGMKKTNDHAERIAKKINIKTIINL